jgi:hypothetical protein
LLKIKVIQECTTVATGASAAANDDVKTMIKIRKEMR